MAPVIVLVASFIIMAYAVWKKSGTEGEQAGRAGGQVITVSASERVSEEDTSKFEVQQVRVVVLYLSTPKHLT